MYYNKSKASIILDNETLNAFTQRLGIRWGCLFSPLLLTAILALSAGVSKKKKHTDLKEEIKLSLSQINV